MIDNSGSNRKIASHIQSGTEYLTVNLKLLDPEAMYLFIYFSDHTDYELYFQPIDYVFPNEEGDRILLSTLKHIEDANGFDDPEAHECALFDVCQLDFGDAVEASVCFVMKFVLIREN